MTAPFRILSLLLCLLVAGPMSTSAHAVARPETRVGDFFPAAPKSAPANPDQTLEPRGENRGCDYDFASGVCKYLYAHADPVNRIDPSGHESLASVNFSMAIISGMVSHELRGAHGALVGARAMFGGDEDLNNIILGMESVMAVQDAVSTVALGAGVLYGGYKLIGFLSNGAKQIKKIRSVRWEDTFNPSRYPDRNGWLPPYRPNTRPREFETAATLNFKRVVVTRPSGVRREGAWLVREDEIAGMTPAQIRDHLGLDGVPSHIQDVAVPAGVKMRVGTAGEQPAFGSKGGGVQYEILEDTLPSSWFSEPRGF